MREKILVYVFYLGNMVKSVMTYGIDVYLKYSTTTKLPKISITVPLPLSPLVYLLIAL